MEDDSAAEHLRLQAEVAELEREHRKLTKQRPPNMADHAEHMRKLRELHSRLEAHRRRLREGK
jgi:hypothetical protein